MIIPIGKELFSNLKLKISFGLDREIDNLIINTEYNELSIIDSQIDFIYVEELFESFEVISDNFKYIVFPEHFRDNKYFVKIRMI